MTKPTRADNRALAICACLSRGGKRLTPRDVSARVELSKTTSLRIPATPHVSLAASSGRRQSVGWIASAKEVSPCLPECEIEPSPTDGSPPYARQMIVSPKDTRTELRPIRERGSAKAVSEHECELGMFTFAVLFLDSGGRPLAVGQTRSLARDMMGYPGSSELSNSLRCLPHGATIAPNRYQEHIIALREDT